MGVELAQEWAEAAAKLRALIVPPAGRDFCEECGGSGSIGSEDRFTDPCTGGGETQWRGYIPTNYCHACEGTGVWPPVKEGAR